MDNLENKTVLLSQMAKIVLPVAGSNPLSANNPPVTYRIVRNTLRKNVGRVQAISTLNNCEKMGDSALEIARNMIEDAVSVSYILSDVDPEKAAAAFFEYRHIQEKQDLNYYSKIPDYLGDDLEKRRSLINDEYKRVLEDFPEFVKKNGDAHHSWSKSGVEGMGEDLRKRGLYSKPEIRNMLRVYQLGSRKVHFNPRGLLGYDDLTSWSNSDKQAQEYSIKGAAAAITSLTVRYFDTVRHYDRSIGGTDVVGQLYKVLASINN